MQRQQTKFGTCRLCGNNAELQYSHILPAFSFRWLRCRGVTGHLRAAKNPNRRSQDGQKEYLLCKSCEQILGNYERGFSSHAFYPAVNGKWSGEYKKWMLKFCVSVSWRILVSIKGINSSFICSDEQEQSCSVAEVIWKDFLLGRIDNPRNCVQHLILWSKISKSTDAKLPKNINRFLSGPIEMDIVATPDFLATYAKIGPFMIFGIIQPGKQIWKGTQVKVNSGRFFEAANILPYSMFGYIKERAANVSKIYDNLSAAQKRQIEKDVHRNINKIHTTPQFASMMDDARLFGIDAITSRSFDKK